MAELSNFEKIFYSIMEVVYVAAVVSYYWKNSKKKSKPKKKSIDEVLFFTFEQTKCTSHFNKLDFYCSTTCTTYNLNKLYNYIKSATKSIDICIYLLTFKPITEILKEMHKKNIDIKIITDYELNENEASQVASLGHIGIKVRTKKSHYMVHHKFCIVDKELVITGSANWTSKAFYGNAETIAITNEYKFVQSYVKEFETLWSKFDIDCTDKSKINENLVKQNLEENSI